MSCEPQQVPGITWISKHTGTHTTHMPPLFGVEQRESDEEEMEGAKSCFYSWGYGKSANYGTQAARWQMVSPLVREQAWRWIEVKVMSPFLFEKQTWDKDMFVIAYKMGLFGKFEGNKDNSAVNVFSSFVSENRFGLQDDSFNYAGMVNTVLSVMAPVIQITANETFNFRTMCYLVKLADLEQSFFKEYFVEPSAEPMNFHFMLDNKMPGDVKVWESISDQLCVAYKQSTGLEFKRTKRTVIQFVLIHSVIARFTLQMISDIAQGNLDIVREMKERLKSTKKLLKLKSYGNESFNLRKWSSAFDLYTSAIKRYPYHATLYSNRCKSSVWMNSPKLARVDGLRVVVLNPTWSKSYHRYADALLLNKRYDEARCVCRKGLSYCERDADREALEMLFIKANEQSKGITLSAEEKERARMAFREASRNNRGKEHKQSPDHRITFAFTIGRSGISDKEFDEFNEKYPYYGEQGENVNKRHIQITKETVQVAREEAGAHHQLQQLHQLAANEAAALTQWSSAVDGAQLKTAYDAAVLAHKKKEHQKGTTTTTDQPRLIDVPTLDGRFTTNGFHQQKTPTKPRSSSTSKKVKSPVKSPVKVSVQSKFVSYKTSAWKAMDDDKFTEAVKNYSLAISLANHEQSLEVGDAEKHLLEYANNMAMLESSNPKAVKEALVSFTQLTTNNTHPMFNLQLARAYYLLNDFKDALQPLEEGIKRCAERRHDYVTAANWPGSEHDGADGTMIVESVMKECCDSLNDLRVDIAFPPQPLSVCRYQECSTDFSRPQMHLSDFGFEGYVQIECDWGCQISFHLKCWSKKKGSCLQHLGLNGDKDVLELDCITDGCNGKIDHVIKFNAEAVAQFQVQATRCDIPKPRNPTITRFSKSEKNMAERRKAMLEAKKRKRLYKQTLKNESLTLEEVGTKEAKVELVSDDRDVTAAQIHIKTTHERANNQAPLLDNGVKATPSKNKEKKQQHQQQRMDLSTFMNTADDRQQYDEGLRSGAGSQHGSHEEEQQQQQQQQQVEAVMKSGGGYQTGMEGHLSEQEAVQMINVTSALGELLDKRGPISRFDRSLDQMFQALDDETRSFVNGKFGDCISLMISLDELYVVDDNFIGLKKHHEQIRLLTEIQTKSCKEIANVDSDFDFSTDEEMSADEEEEVVPPVPTFQAPSVPRPAYPMPSFETTESVEVGIVENTSPPPGLEKVVGRQQSVDEHMSSEFACQPPPEPPVKQPFQQVTGEEVNELLQRIKELEGLVTVAGVEKDAAVNRGCRLDNQIKEKDEVFNNLLHTCKSVEEEKVMFKSMAEQSQVAREQLDKQFETQKKAFETQLRSLQEVHDATSAENRQLQQDCIQMKNITETLGSTNRIMMEEKVRLHQLCNDSHVKLLEMAKSLRNIEISAKVEIGRQLAAIISQFYMKYDQQFVQVCVRDLSQSVDNLTGILESANQWFDKHMQEVKTERFNEKFLEDKNLTQRPVVHDFFKPFVSFQKRMLETIEDFNNSRGVATMDNSTQSDPQVTSPQVGGNGMLNGNRTTTSSSNLHQILKQLQARFPDVTSKELALSVWQVRQQMSHETINVDAIVNRVTINIYRSTTSNNTISQSLPRVNDYSLQAIGKLQAHEECFLCQDSLMLSAHLAINCGHTFHVTCIDTWTQRHRKCPACYLPVVR